jgi:hypothetical protein
MPINHKIHDTAGQGPQPQVSRVTEALMREVPGGAR